MVENYMAQPTSTQPVITSVFMSLDIGSKARFCRIKVSPSIIFILHIARLLNITIVMDLLRHYYLQESMTAPAYRIEYIYTLTPGPNLMRHFLITTAAYRCLDEKPEADGVYMTDSMKALFAKNSEISSDFTNAAIDLHRNGTIDVRRGWDCTFHVHKISQKCPPYIQEA